MEYLDIVDETDRPLGKDTRANIHARHLIHRGVHVFIVNQQGELLIQKRAAARDYYPGHWDASLGAQVRSGESYAQAASRELNEELGISVAELKQIAKYRSFSSRQREIRTLFLTAHDGPFRLDQNEVEQTEFVPPDEIKIFLETGTRRFTQGFIKSFEHYLDFLVQADRSEKKPSDT